MLFMFNKRALILFFAVEFFTAINSLELTSNIRKFFKKRINSIDRISRHGYPAESHKIRTHDGYILQIFRIPYSAKQTQPQQQPKPAILLLHGMLSSSDAFLMNGPNNGLPFLLADSGYDVWLGNARGNIYSRKHIKHSVRSRAFWRFSWHEIGTTDIAAMIDYILELTGQNKLYYAAHSQGAAVFLVLMSTRPEYNEKIHMAHLLAPVAFMGNTEDGLIIAVTPLIGTPGKWSKRLGDYELSPSNPHTQYLLARACGNNVRFPRHCRYLFDFYTNGKSDNINMTLAPQIAETHPAGASTNQLIHYSQEYVSKQFRPFDYGWEGNILHYGQKNPPNYQLEKVTSSVYIYYSDYDETAKTVDVRKLAAKLPNVRLLHNVSFAKWTHLDFNWAFNVKTVVYDLLVTICNNHNKTTNESK